MTEGERRKRFRTPSGQKRKQDEGTSWAEKNRDRAREIARASYHHNRKERLEKQKAYRDSLTREEREAMRRYRRDYYQENRDGYLADQKKRDRAKAGDEEYLAKRREQWRKRYQANREEILTKQREAYQKRKAEQIRVNRAEIPTKQREAYQKRKAEQIRVNRKLIMTLWEGGRTYTGISIHLGIPLEVVKQVVEEEKRNGWKKYLY